MAHNLMERNGRVAMVYQGATPWHQLGTRIAGDEGLDRALEMAGLAFDVALSPVFTERPDGTRQFIESHRAVLDPSGSPLAVVSDQYRIIQYRAAFEPLRPMIEEVGCQVAAAGALGQGERAWVLLRLPDSTDQTIVEGDDVRGYALAFSGHDGRTSASFRPTPIRVVCQNTLDAAIYRGTNLLTVRHTDSAPARLDTAAKVLEAMTKSMVETGDTFRAMAGRMLTREEVADLIQTLIPVPTTGDSPTLRTRRDSIARLVWNGKGAELTLSGGREDAERMARDATAWSVYNAVTEYVDHVRPGEAKSTSGVVRANLSAIVGTGAALKTRAFHQLRELVAA
jgi:phage/plasmid-like protein (TIGR03299 family)